MPAKADVIKVVMVGSGNVAMQLAMLLNISGNKIIQVISRNKKPAGSWLNSAIAILILN